MLGHLPHVSLEQEARSESSWSRGQGATQKPDSQHPPSSRQTSVLKRPQPPTNLTNCGWHANTVGTISHSNHHKRGCAKERFLYTCVCVCVFMHEGSTVMVMIANTHVYSVSHPGCEVRYGAKFAWPGVGGSQRRNSEFPLTVEGWEWGALGGTVVRGTDNGKHMHEACERRSVCCDWGNVLETAPSGLHLDKFCRSKFSLTGDPIAREDSKERD